MVVLLDSRWSSKRGPVADLLEQKGRTIGLFDPCFLPSLLELDERLVEDKMSRTGKDDQRPKAWCSERKGNWNLGTWKVK